MEVDVSIGKPRAAGRSPLSRRARGSENRMAASKVATVGGRKVRVVRLRTGAAVEQAYERVDAAFGREVRKLVSKREKRLARAEEAAANFMITH
jgi:hypothetical protein